MALRFRPREAQRCEGKVRTFDGHGQERMRKPIMDQGMISQSRSHDWACKGPSAEMTAWQHLVLEEGQDDKPGMGRATALLDMTKCFEQGEALASVGMGCSWNFPGELLRVILLIFSFQRRVLDSGARHLGPPRRTQGSLLDKLSRARSCTCCSLGPVRVAPTATYEVCGRLYYQVQ